MYFLFVLLGFAGSLLSSLFGFGSAMLVLAIGPYLLPAHQVIALSAILFAASTLTKTIIFRAFLNWQLVGYITLGSLPFAYMGGQLLPCLSQQTLHRCLGVLILIYVSLQSAAFYRGNYRTNPNTASHILDSNKKATGSEASRAVENGATGKFLLIIVSAGYGFASGLVGSGSVIKAMFFRRLHLCKEAFVGTMAATSLVATIGKITAYAQNGLLQREMLPLMITLVAAAALAAFIGRRYLKRINSKIFNNGVLVLLIIAAMGLLL